MNRGVLVAILGGWAVVVLLFQGRFVYVERFQFRSPSQISTPPSEEMTDLAAHNHCLSLDLEDSMDGIISNAEHIFITMPAKAAGTSMKSFTRLCTKRRHRDNFINDEKERRDYLTESLDLSPLVASHVYTDKPFIHLARHATPRTLIIQMYRDETDRLSSAIDEVIKVRLCKGEILLPDLKVEFNATHCVVEEESLLRLISSKDHEIGIGAPAILTCAAYDAIVSNEPNLAFVSYKMADKLQKIIATHHCPELVDNPVRENVAEEKKIFTYIRLPKDGEEVLLDVWLHHKKHLLEWGFDLRNSSSCQAKTRHLADTLSACPDKAIKVTANMVAKW